MEHVLELKALEKGVPDNRIPRWGSGGNRSALKSAVCGFMERCEVASKNLVAFLITCTNEFMRLVEAKGFNPNYLVKVALDALHVRAGIDIKISGISKIYRMSGQDLIKKTKAPPFTFSKNELTLATSAMSN